MGVGPSGRVRTKPQVILDFTSGDLKFQSIATDDVQVRVLWEHGCGDRPLNNEWARQRPNCPPRHSLYQSVGKAARALAVGCQPLLVPDCAPISSHSECLTNRMEPTAGRCPKKVEG